MSFRSFFRASIVAIAAVLALLSQASATPHHGKTATRARTVDTIQWSISRDHRHVDFVHLVNGQVVGFIPHVPTKSSYERWFALPHGHGVAQYYVTPGGSPVGLDTSQMVADIQCQPPCATFQNPSPGVFAMDVAIVAGSVSISFPYSVGLGLTTASNSSAGVSLWNTVSMDSLEDSHVTGAADVYIAGPASVPVAQAANTGYNSGVCFNSVSDNAHCGTGPAGVTGCTATTILPCYWDVSKSQGFNGSLVGHTVYGIAFHAGQSMLTLNVALACVDNTTFTADATHPMVIADLTHGTSMGSEQSWAIGSDGGRTIKNDWFCELFGINANTTPLSTTALQNVEFLIR